LLSVKPGDNSGATPEIGTGDIAEKLIGNRLLQILF
jgi:hypothetical protein